MIFIGHINIELLCNVGIIQVSIHSNIISKNFTYYKKKKKERETGPRAKLHTESCSWDQW